MSEQTTLTGQVALVTGASSGIGRATALALAGAGARVVLAARRQSKLEAVVSEIRAAGGGEALAVSTDVADDEQVERLVRTAREAWGPIDILVNNAGIGAIAPVEAIDMAKLDEIMRVNFRAVVLTTKLVLPDMLARRSGAIVNIGSVSSRKGWPRGTPYVASKFALRGFALCLWEEVRKQGIRVMNLYPDFVDSDFFAAAGPRPAFMDRAIPPADVAATIVASLQLDARTTAVEIDLLPTNLGR